MADNTTEAVNGDITKGDPDEMDALKALDAFHLLTAYAMEVASGDSPAWIELINDAREIAENILKVEKLGEGEPGGLNYMSVFFEQVMTVRSFPDEYNSEGKAPHCMKDELSGLVGYAEKVIRRGESDCDRRVSAVQIFLNRLSDEWPELTGSCERAAAVIETAKTAPRDADAPVYTNDTLPDDPGKPPFERLTAKLDAELGAYHAELLTKSKEHIIGMATFAASMSDAYFMLTEELDLSGAQIAALLEADTPLRDVSEVLRDSNNQSMCLLDTGTILEAAHIAVPAEPVEPSAPRPRTVRDWIDRGREEMKNRQREPKAEPGHKKRDTEL